MVYQTEKQLKEFEDKLPDNVKQPVKDGIEKLKKQLEANDTEGMKATMKEVEEHLMQFGQQIYQQQQQQQQPGGASAGADAEPKAEEPKKKKNDDGIVDAEIVD
jgi:hypothetical protein